MLRIVTYPHPALRYESVPVLQIDDELRTRVREMLDLMYEHKGVGLAANQVGLPFQFFVLNVTSDPSQKEHERVFINPEIVKRHSSNVDEEGCLSLPGLYGDVPRAKRVRVRAYDLNGAEIEVDAEELMGRAIQHEIDHLLGRLFIDYLTPDAFKAASPKIREIETCFRKEQREGMYPPDAQLNEQLRILSQR